MSKNVVGNEILLDSWEQKGNSYPELVDLLEVIDASTKVAEVRKDGIGIYTVKAVDSKKEVVTGWLHAPNATIKNYSFDELKEKHGAFPELIAELGRNLRMLCLNGYLFFVDGEILTTLSQRGGCRIGEAFLRNEAHMRFLADEIMAQYMYLPDQKDKLCHVVFREVGGAKKALGVLTDRHAPIPQKESVEAVMNVFTKELGKAELVSFTVNGTETVVYVEFPEKAKDFTNVVKDAGTVKGISVQDEVCPGIMIRTADGGDSSFTVIGTVRIGRMLLYLPAAKFARAHTKNVDLSNIEERLKKQVFAEFTKIPDRLCELVTIDVTDPHLAVEKVARYCGIKKALGLGAENRVIREIQELLNPSVAYTAYDLAMLFLDEGRSLEPEYSRDESLGKIRYCFVQALFFKYEGL